MILSWQKEFTTPFEEISSQELNKCLQKFYLSAEKATTSAVRSLCAKIVIVVATLNELKIFIFVLNYLTVLLYTKTSIHLSVGGHH